MCEHCGKDNHLSVEDILTLPELQSGGHSTKQWFEESDGLTLEELNRIKEEVAEEIKMENLDDIHSNENLDINSDKILEMLDYNDIKKEIRGYELIFLSHPFADDPVANKQRVDFLAKEIRSNNPNAIILSPLHSFSYFDTDDMRDAIMYECYQMIERADTCVFIQYDGFLSSGQSDEIIYAEEIGKNIEMEEVDQLMLDKKLGIR